MDDYVELMHPALREWVLVPIDKIVFDALADPNYWHRLTPADEINIGLTFAEAACCNPPVALDLIEAVVNLPAARDWVSKMVGTVKQRAGYIVWGWHAPKIALAIHPETNRWLAVDLTDPTGFAGLFNPNVWPMTPAERAAVETIACDAEKAKRRSKIEIAAEVLGPRKVGQIIFCDPAEPADG